MPANHLCTLKQASECLTTLPLTVFAKAKFVTDFLREKMQFYLGGVVALSVECRTYDQEVVSSSLGRARGVKNPGHVLHTYVPLFTKQYKLVPAKGR